MFMIPSKKLVKKFEGEENDLDTFPPDNSLSLPLPRYLLICVLILFFFAVVVIIISIIIVIIIAAIFLDVILFSFDLSPLDRARLPGHDFHLIFPFFFFPFRLFSFSPVFCFV